MGSPRVCKYHSVPRSVAVLVVVSLALLAVPMVATPALAAQPDWAGNPRLDGAGEIAARIIEGTAPSDSGNPHGVGASCAAESSASGNVMVNCLTGDGTSPANTQSETDLAVTGNKVVVGFNDSSVCCIPAANLSGYSVSTDGGKTFTDKGNLPFRQDVQPIGDPVLASDPQGNIYFASLALGAAGLGAHSLIALYEMPAGATTFTFKSIVVDVGSGTNFFADKEELAVGLDGSGHLHFYVTWTLFSRAAASPIFLSDSTDGLTWRTTMVSTSDACAQSSNPLPAGGTVFVSWQQGLTCASRVTENEIMATVDVSSAAVQGRTVIGSVHGVGDAIVRCGRGMRQVIETTPGHDIRVSAEPVATIDANGTLYAVWNDRPNGVGGANSNATRIMLSFSRDGNHTWSTPQVISGRISSRFMNDRFQPWIVADSQGLHAIWYERVQGTSVDQIRTDRRDLSFATPTAPPAPLDAESALSTVSFPVVQTNPNQDPVIASCYMGDYNTVVSSGSSRFATWGDNRNVVTTTIGAENEPDVFLDTF
jgi:hypothetical protein